MKKIKLFFRISIYSFIFFCLITCFRYFIEGFYLLISPNKVSINIGFPFAFQKTEWLDNDEIKGINYFYFIIDYLIHWIIVFLFSKRKKQQL